MKKLINDFINNNYKLDKKMFIAIMCGAAVCGGVYGLIYETIFYYFNNGVLCRRGSSFGPWIEIYGIGALLIYWLTRKYKKSPLKVFLLSGIVCGILEYLAGWGMYTFLDGRRGWNYNTEILNFGNINGFVCLRSVLVFAFSGLLLMYVVMPILLYLSKKMNRNTYISIMYVLGILFFIDVFYNDVIVTLFHTYSSKDFYCQFEIFKYYNESKIH